MLTFSLRYQEMLQGASSETTTQVVAIVSLPVLLLVGWLVAIVLGGVGATNKNPNLVSLGFVGVGLMTIATPFTFYLYETLRRGGVYPAMASDFLLIGLLTTVGSVTIAYGTLRLRGKKASA